MSGKYYLFPEVFLFLPTLTLFSSLKASKYLVFGNPVRSTWSKCFKNIKHSQYTHDNSGVAASFFLIASCTIWAGIVRAFKTKSWQYSSYIAPTARRKGQSPEKKLEIHQPQTSETALSRQFLLIISKCAWLKLLGCSVVAYSGSVLYCLTFTQLHCMRSQAWTWHDYPVWEKKGKSWSPFDVYQLFCGDTNRWCPWDGY